MRWRDLVLPRWGEPRAKPPWAGETSGSLESHRFEHGGAHHRLQLRVHEDGSGLVIVDARRLARLQRAEVLRLRSWLAAGAPDADALEELLWHAPVLTGSGPPRAVNAWDPALQRAQVLPGVPLVATVEVAPGTDAAGWARELHRLGVPHLVLRGEGGALVSFVRAAEDLGLVTGVAGTLPDESTLRALAEAGLDHLVLPLAGPDGSHDAVYGAGSHGRVAEIARRAAELEIPLTAETPLTSSNALAFPATLREAERLGMLGVTAWALVDPSGSTRAHALTPSALRPVAAAVERAADTGTLGVTWAAPVVAAGSLQDELARGPRTDGDFGMRVLRDGSLLPPRGSTQPAGVLGRSDWAEIRTSPSWRSFLAQAEAPTRCAECPGLALCAVDCPADREGWA